MDSDSAGRVFIGDCEHEDVCTISYFSSSGVDSKPLILCSSCYSKAITDSRATHSGTDMPSLPLESSPTHQCLLCGMETRNTFAEGKFALCQACMQSQREQVEKAENIMVTRVLCEDGYAEEPDCILEDKLFLGSQFSACSLQTLNRLNIAAILVCGKNLPKFFAHDPASGIQYHNLPIEDSLNQDIVPYVHSAMRFLQEFIIERKQRVLVHCAAGVSRSASVIIAYLMLMNQWDFDTAKSYAKAKRVLVNPNLRFTQDLKLFWEPYCLSLQDSGVVDENDT